MGKTLLIVESPAKAKTIGRYLGSDYIVAASVGHVRDLPTSTLGVDVKNGFKPRYITMQGKEAVIRDLKSKKELADRVLLATDPDREGEAIAWHLAHLLKIQESDPCRVTFNEITKPAILKAVENPRQIDMALVDAQQSRRILDRLVGYELSPLLWEKIMKGLSAGRVQSLATRMVVQREREIQGFQPEEYWILTAHLLGAGQTLTAKYHGQMKSGKVSSRQLKTKEETDALIAECRQSPFVVQTVKKSQSKRSPYPPFTTSTLQQEASRVLGFTSQRTMRVAQQLYEGVNIDGEQTSLITYIRTDSVRISPEAQSEVRQLILQQHGEKYLPEKPRLFKNKKSAQDAHEAIRPAHFDLPPSRVFSSLEADQYKLYRLIWNKFCASQMTEAIFDTLSYDIASGQQVFRAKGETLVFPGWMVLYEKQSQEDEEEATSGRLPEFETKTILECQKLVPEQKFTQPPSRYTEASLIKALEEEGVGRPSTYAPTLSTILQRNYVEKEEKKLRPTELGQLVTELLEEHFPEVVNTEFTAQMEGRLDEVEMGNEAWQQVLSDFYPQFHAQIQQASQKIEKKLISDKPIGEKCPQCQTGDLLIKKGRYGDFIACSNYPDCQYSRPIEIEAPGKCPLCGSHLLQKRTRKGRHSVFYVCDKKGADPNCSFIS